MVMLAICSLSFTAFAIPREDLGDRMSIVLTLLLTAVAFKLVIADSLPKVSYFTALDTYMNAMFLLLFMVCLSWLACHHAFGVQAHASGLRPLLTATTLVPAQVAVENGITAELARQDLYVEGIESLTFGSVAVFFVVFHAYFLCRVVGYRRENRRMLHGARRAGDAHHAKVAAMVQKKQG
jgi:heme/copper-type cytochrome/quinol oxidase subunit 2